MATHSAEHPKMASPQPTPGHGAAAPRGQGPAARGQPALCLPAERYLRAQPAVRLLLRGLLRELMLCRPRNVLEFAAEYFTDPELPRKIREQLEASRKGC